MGPEYGNSDRKNAEIRKFLDDTTCSPSSNIPINTKNTMNIPIIRLEVEGMKHSISAALLEHQAKMDADVIAAVEAYCQPENISYIIHEASRTALDNAIREEVKAFFWLGEGRKAVAEAVKETLLKRESYTPMDNVG